MEIIDSNWTEIKLRESHLPETVFQNESSEVRVDKLCLLMICTVALYSVLSTHLVITFPVTKLIDETQQCQCCTLAYTLPKIYTLL